MTTNDKPVTNRFNPLLIGDAEEIAALVVRSMSEPALPFPWASFRAPDATSVPTAPEKAVIQEQI